MIHNFLIPLLLLIQASRLNADQKLRGIHRWLESDPKTVVSKDDSQAIGRLPFLFIGTSMSIENPRNNAYPYLVSSNVVMIDSDDLHASRCVVSLLKERTHREDAFDVIVLELGESDPTIALAKRLRHRFPEALILIWDMWRPRHYHHEPSGMPLMDWIGAQHDKGTEKEKIIQVMQELTHAGEWMYQHRPDQSRIRNQVKTIENCILIEPPLPANVNDAMTSTSFRDDLNSYSISGHQFIAILLKQALNGFRTVHKNVVQPWEHLDSCENWLNRGRAPKFEHNMLFSEFEPIHWAIESHGTFDAWIKFVNPDSSRLGLILQYLPSTTFHQYKLTSIKIEGQEPVTICGKSEVRPHALEVEEIHVGYAAPGETTIQFEGVPRTPHGEPVRIVGLLLVPMDTL